MQQRMWAIVCMYEACSL